ncbi:MAG: hypothetical protein ACOYNC_10130 [Bacteroidales bacterium]
MKKLQLLLAIFICSISASIGQGIPPAPADKAVVYFIRSSNTGFAINFSYFDSDRLFGLFAGKGYIRYECSPGSHLFWARSENKDFVEAEVDAGKVYFIEAIVQMGFVKAAVRLQPIDPTNQRKMKGILKIIEKNEPESLTDEDVKIENEKFQDVITRGLEKYKEEKVNGEKFNRLEKTMFLNK